ncbi:hypothetical protein GOP47_0001773 [Adiantum capillus-veneris]|nr:hypothetical protein GOP47_0001773 [Adiantum capillus-veneris]
MDAIKSYCCFSSFIPKSSLQRLATSCYFQGKCHPLYLKLKAVQLEIIGNASFNDQKWEGLVSSLESDGGNADGNKSEEAIQRAVEKSLDILPSHLQNLFIDLVAWCHCLKFRFYGVLVDGPIKEDFLCCHYNDGTKDAMFYKVLELEYHGLLEVKDDANKRRSWGIAERLVIHDLHKHVAESRVGLPQYTNLVVNHAVSKKDLSRFPSYELASKKHVCGIYVEASTLRTLFRTCFKTKTPPVQIQVIRVAQILEGAPLLQRLKSLNFKGGNMEALRYLSLGGSKCIKEIKGWEGVPNLMWLQLDRHIGLERIEPLGCLKRLETPILKFCKNLQVQALVGAGAVHTMRSLFKEGDRLPKLQILYIVDNAHLVEVGPVSPDTFPTLKTLELGGFQKLERFPDLKLGDLRSLKLNCCPKLRRVEGSLRALQELHLFDCKELESIPDLRNLGSLWSLQVEHCPSLRGIKLNETRHLEHLSIPIKLVSMDIDVLPLIWDAVWCDDDQVGHSQSPCGSTASVHNPFINLQSLSLTEFASEGARHVNYWLDVSGLPSLQKLKMRFFESVQNLSICPSPLLRELCLGNFPSLEEISGLGAGHVHLIDIHISECPMLVGIPGLHALPGLKYLDLRGCDNYILALNEYSAGAGSEEDIIRLGAAATWTILPRPFPVSLEELELKSCFVEKFLASDIDLTSLKILRISECTALTDVSSVAALTSLEQLWISKCTALTDVSGITALTSLRRLGLSRCKSLRNLPDLKHLTCLEVLSVEEPGSCWTLSEEALQQMVKESCNIYFFTPAKTSIPRWRGGFGFLRV